ncbi:unnamed protein product [Paramecium primaurelia]|uniref:Uncharacterized protein n=1 Tax=Paramecium primaurelia TaxID=5886 RepID=A0A8S1LXD7_PARPR|nr:unnamed protein product [Paramecium primaurelia]
MQNNPVLQKFLQNNPFIEGIVLMDKEGIEIIAAFQNENNKLRTGAQSLMYVVAIQQCNENLRKLSDSETKQITLVYDEWILYFEIWTHSILIFYCNSILKSNKGIIQVQDRKLLILGGTVTKGIIKKGQSLLIGPDKQGNFYPVQVQNLQSNRVKVKSALSGQLCTVQFQLINSYKKNFGTAENPIRRGMVLVDAKLKPNSYTIFIVNLQFFAAGWKQFQQQQQQQELISINQTQQYNYPNEKICLSQSHELLVHTPYSKQICLILENHCENQYLLVKQPSLTRKPSKSVEGKVVSSSQKYIEKNKSKKIKIQQKINVFEIKSGESLQLKLRFKYQSEYLTQGMKIVIMEQKFSAFGHVVSMEI